MKKHRYLLTAPVFSLLLMGCNTHDAQATNVPNALVEGITVTYQVNVTNSENAITTSRDVAFRFTEFDLDVTYGPNQEFDVEYEENAEGIEVEVKDDKGKMNQKGDEAITYLSPIFESFKFDHTTPDADVISEVVKAFKLDENYQTFELEVTFTDGTKKVYKEKK